MHLWKQLGVFVFLRQGLSIHFCCIILHACYVVCHHWLLGFLTCPLCLCLGRRRGTLKDTIWTTWTCLRPGIWRHVFLGSLANVLIHAWQSGFTSVPFLGGCFVDPSSPTFGFASSLKHPLSSFFLHALTQTYRQIPLLSFAQCPPSKQGHWLTVPCSSLSPLQSVFTLRISSSSPSCSLLWGLIGTVIGIDIGIAVCCLFFLLLLWMVTPILV